MNAPGPKPPKEASTKKPKWRRARGETRIFCLPRYLLEQILQSAFEAGVMAEAALHGPLEDDVPTLESMLRKEFKYLTEWEKSK